MNNIENNQATIIGKIVSGFNFDHDTYGEKFYIVNVNAERLSDACDVIPVTVSDRLIDVSKDYTGQFVSVTGQFRSYNKHDGERNHLVLSVFAREMEFLDNDNEDFYANKISLDGYICKEPTYRKTPLGREIADFLLAVNRQYGKSDYIPCIAWGRNARYVVGLDVGTHVFTHGRIQSRKYEKRVSPDKVESRTAYEVSVSSLEVHEDEE